jgi:glycine/D-amino acid oxidase-like deaminating enzyme
VARLLGEELPVTSELHLKAAFREHRRVVPSHAPLLIWSDPQRIDWSPEAVEMLSESPQGRVLLDELPGACHGRPDGSPDSPYVLVLWAYRRNVMEPTWPLPADPLYPELVLRGMTTMVPGLNAYRDRLPHATVDGGYYTKTVENLPLIGPMSTLGAYVVGALSGFGVMAAAGAGELVALHVTGRPLPAYAPALLPSRYDDPDYAETLELPAEGGQL